MHFEAAGVLRQGVCVHACVHLTALQFPAAVAELADCWREREEVKRKGTHRTRKMERTKREKTKRVQLLLLHEHCSDSEQLGPAGCFPPQQQQQQQVVCGWQMVLDPQSCWLVVAEVGVAMQGGTETVRDPPCSRQGLMGQIWQGCCPVLPCPKGDQRLSDRLQSSQPAITCSTLCCQWVADNTALPEASAYLELHISTRCLTSCRLPCAICMQRFHARHNNIVEQADCPCDQ